GTSVQSEPIRTITTAATIRLPTGAPVPAMESAPLTDRARFFGLATASAKARPAVLPGVKVSIAFIQPGVPPSSPPAGRLRHCITASARNRTPKASFTHSVQVAGAPPPAEALRPEATSRTTVTTTPSPTAQARAKAGPLVRALGVES